MGHRHLTSLSCSSACCGSPLPWESPWAWRATPSWSCPNLLTWKSHFWPLCFPAPTSPAQPRQVHSFQMGQIPPVWVLRSSSRASVLLPTDSPPVPVWAVPGGPSGSHGGTARGCKAQVVRAALKSGKRPPTSLRGVPGGGGGVGSVVTWLWIPAHFVSAAKGAGKLAAEAGGGDAAGPEAGAAEVTLSGGELRCGLEGEALEAGIQCPRARESPEPAGKHHQAAGAGRKVLSRAMPCPVLTLGQKVVFKFTTSLSCSSFFCGSLLPQRTSEPLSLTLRPLVEPPTILQASLSPPPRSSSWSPPQKQSHPNSTFTFSHLHSTHYHVWQCFPKCAQCFSPHLDMCFMGVGGLFGWPCLSGHPLMRPGT